MSVELKPCPFCRGKAAFVRLERTAFPWRVKCGSCGALSDGSVFRNDEWLAEKWNTRAAPAVKPLEWQPIETAPKDGTWIMGFRPTKHFQDQWEVWRWVQTNDFIGWENAADTSDFDERPTHWMPLPAPPSDAQRDEDKK